MEMTAIGKNIFIICHSLPRWRPVLGKRQDGRAKGGDFGLFSASGGGFSPLSLCSMMWLCPATLNIE